MTEHNKDSLMPFGVHKGKVMEDVPRSYLRFIYKKFNWGTMKPMGAEADAVCRYIMDNDLHK